MVSGLIAATALALELPPLVETVEVRVVNVDVVVSDGEGRPVRGLRRDDFELEVDGRPVSVEYFSAVVGGAAAGGAPDGEPEPAAVAASLPYLAIVFDGRVMRPASARDALTTLSERLDSLLASSRAIMVVRQGGRLVVEQAMTRDRGLLEAAIERLAAARTPALDGGGRGQLLQRLESLNPPPLASEAVEEVMADRARRLLREIRTQAEFERFAAEESGRQLRSVVRSLAGLPGRKAILLLAQGLRERPADALFRLWWSKFNHYGPRIGVSNIEAAMGPVRSDDLLQSVVRDANAGRVTFFSHDPAGLRFVGSSVEYSSLEANLRLSDETERELDTLLDLAVATGGAGRARATGLGPLLDEMIGGFESYYSLGFTPGEADRGRVRLRLTRPGLRLRYLRRFAVRTPAQLLQEATLATLLTSIEDNRLEVSVEIGEIEPQPNGQFVVPLLIKVPMARLSLLPRRARHVGRLSFVVMAQGTDGGLSAPATGEVPIEIANGELLSVMAGMAGYRLRLRIAAGDQIVAIGVRDEVARQDATLRLVLTPGRGV